MDEAYLNGKSALHQRIPGGLSDSFDEELELEIDDDRLDALLDDLADHPEREMLDRRLYFKELFRLQRELVKLQDGVSRQKLKVVAIFEGRDSAGKGGTIKRFTQRLNPRICRIARYRRRTSASGRNGAFSATSRIPRQTVRSCSSTAAGTTAPASSM